MTATWTPWRGGSPDRLTSPRGTSLGWSPPRGACWWRAAAVREPLARAFLEAGYDGYVGATEDYVDGDSALLFTIGFFYHLLADERDYAPRTFTDREAAERAAAMDYEFELGTRPYRYWGPEDVPAHG